MTVIPSDGIPVDAITYVADKSAIDAKRQPYGWYKDFVLQGSQEHKLPVNYVTNNIEAVPAVPDPDSEREKAKRAEVTKPHIFQL